MEKWAELDKQFLMPTYQTLKLPIAIHKGEGNYLYDTDGKAYLDLFTGLAVNVVGHSHPKIVQTLKEQGERFLHISNVYLNPPAITLAKRLSEATTGGKVFFTNSGAEATEAAIKLIHKYRMKQAPERDGIVVLKRGFHGRTLGALKLTRQPHVYQDFPLPDYKIIEIEPENIEELKAAMKEKPLAVLMEPVLGSAGVYPLSKEYLQEVQEICKQENVLLCMDEIQTGMGRTGTLFAYEQASIQPDIILFAKGVGGGLPLGGVIAKPEFSNLFGPGDHGTTFAPSPLSSALGNTVLDLLVKDGLLEKSRGVSEYLWSELNRLKADYDVINELRGKGFMVGIVLNGEPETARNLRLKMLEEGILIDLTQKTIIRLLPPLTLEKEDVDRFITALKKYL
ncbi:acetylornithine aminotransferase [Scopulibacillus darangshiensis]|uniref:Acetylornithine aminotransferase n=1 Tax=Scopulibacillus darangshiensis TaxID=442528 RepID=A0A4R2P8H6_9BACL|nr:acetylornithine transaminase [Scopulibacillus darangshiensis]TCP30544.1 acetylornithine aminotransferase [Scopulibacillus darangshiensis]